MTTVMAPLAHGCADEMEAQDLAVRWPLLSERDAPSPGAQMRLRLRDPHATILHLIGRDHTLLASFRGVQGMPLTDVHVRLSLEPPA
jgi:hypothetical protein